MVLLRRVIGDALRARRQGQHRTLREISTAANVSLGYLSEIERGQKEASSELLAAICEALGSQLSEVLREASDSLARAEGSHALMKSEGAEALTPAEGAGARSGEEAPVPAEAGRAAEPAPAATSGEVPQARRAADSALSEAQTVTDGEVSVSVRRDGPLRTTLHTVRTRPGASVAPRG
ncbi:MAG TPA: helix-turn-helix domain-containing protein [Natronosporangium sp.]|nr:helix-turn-helix domain-containing protein [Natronosporangium sp.]